MNGRWFRFKRAVSMNPYEFCVFWFVAKVVRGRAEGDRWLDVQDLRARFRERSEEMERDLSTLAAMRLVDWDREKDRVTVNLGEVEVTDQ